MVAKDVMSSPVATIAPGTTVREIAVLLVARRVSGVPVVADNRVVGIVSEGDLVRRHEIGTERRARDERWWMRLLPSDRGPADYVASHAVHARDIMSRKVVAITDALPVGAIVGLFERHRIRRVPVLRGSSLVGIVTRADLVKAFASTEPAIDHIPADDERVRRRLLAELARQPWWRDDSNVTVEQGVVHYWGVVYSDDEAAAARVAAQNMPGVHGILDHRFKISAMSSMV